MRIYIVKEDYINYLKKFDDNIRDNKNESRPYIGILLEVNGMNYIAPLASPKEKHNRKYSILLTKQIRFINKNEDVIKNKANKLYNKVISGRSFIAKRCVNFELIEKKALEYNSDIREAAVTKTVGIKDIVKDASKKADEHNKKKEKI